MSKIGNIVDRIKGLWDVFDIAAKVLAVAPIAAVAVAAWLKVAGHWGLLETRVPNWILAGLVVAAAGTLIAIALRFFIGFRGSTETPFNFYEETLGHLWRLNIKPYIWIERDIDRDYIPDYVQSVVSGPFHAADGCGAPLFSTNDAGDALVVMGRCGRCQKDTPLKGLDRAIGVEQLKLGVLRELQRVHRNGETLRRNIRIRIIP